MRLPGRGQAAAHGRRRSTTRSASSCRRRSDVKGGALKVDVKEGVVTLSGTVEMRKAEGQGRQARQKGQGRQEGGQQHQRFAANDRGRERGARTAAVIRNGPLIGVGAIILQRDRILMAQRGKEPLKGWWSLPGGAAGNRRIPGGRRSAAKRARRPGWKSGPSGCSKSSSASCATRRGAPEYHYVLIDYVCRITGGTLAPETTPARWSGCGARDLPQPADHRRHPGGD